MVMLTLSLVLAAEPLSVRVLEHFKPVAATLEGSALTCDGKPLPNRVELGSGQKAVRAGEASCIEVTAKGEATVKVDEQTRRYSGTLHVLLEGQFLRFVNDVDVEPYVASVVSSELGDAPVAALEAQAITSRTFALAGRRRHGPAGYDLCDLTHCQLYRGRGEETAGARAAAEKTKGQVLLIGGVSLKPAFFHAACGGHTSRANDVFQENGPGPGVSDLDHGTPRCAAQPEFSWEWSVERGEFASALNMKPEGAAFEALRRDAGGRVLELKVFGKRFSGNEFIARVGRTFGYQTIRSMSVTAQESDTTVVFHGVGLGHGVGLCQQGARQMAKSGATTAAILKHYYPDAQVRVP